MPLAQPSHSSLCRWRPCSFHSQESYLSTKMQLKLYCRYCSSSRKPFLLPTSDFNVLSVPPWLSALASTLAHYAALFICSLLCFHYKMLNLGIFFLCAKHSAWHRMSKKILIEWVKNEWSSKTRAHPLSLQATGLPMPFQKTSLSI